MQSSKKTKLVVSILFLLSLLNSHSVAETELDGLEKLKPYKLPPIEKSQAHYLTPENTLSASRSSLLSKDLKWHQQAFTQEALVYINQLYAAAGIDPATVFQLTDANDEEYLLEIIPYKDGILVVVETHYNDTDGRILTTAGVLVQENGLWKITFDYHEDGELEQYESIRYTNCIASYTFYPDAKDDMCFHSNDLTIKSNVLDTFDLRNGKNQATLIFNGVDSVLGQSNGVQGNPSNHFKGMIDDIQIFNIALNKEQVLEKMTPDYR